MTALAKKLYVFSGAGVSLVQDLVQNFKEHAAIVRPLLENCADALSQCYPDLYGDDLAMRADVQQPFDLLEALENDSFPELEEPVAGSLSIISQLTNYFVFLKTSGVEHPTKTAAVDQEGLLPAIAAASSESDAEFSSNAATAVRAAFYAALRGPESVDVEKEWQTRGIAFRQPRIPVLAGPQASDLRNDADLRATVARLMGGKNRSKWDEVYKKTEDGVEKRTGKQVVKDALLAVGAPEAGDWQLESAGAGGVTWMHLGVSNKKQWKGLLAELRASPLGADLPDDALEKWHTAGDMVKRLDHKDTPPRSSWQWKDVNWAMVYLLAVVHALAVWGAVKLWLGHRHGFEIFRDAAILYPLTGMLGITAGAHRLWAHRSYKAHFPARLVMMIANSIANQGSIFHWARDHRVHHAKSDTEADPHDMTRGFFYAHMGWLMLKKRQAVKDAGKLMKCDDLLADPLVAIQHKLDPLWNQAFCFGLPTLYAAYMYDEALMGFLVIGCLRWIVTLHATWCVNSVAHLYGPRPYTPNMNPSESWFTTVVAVGEGWHNWHHTYPYDYSASELGWLGCFNPTTLWIDFLWCIGQAYNRKRAVHHKKAL